MRARLTAVLAALALTTSACAVIERSSRTPAGGVPAGPSTEASLNRDGTVVAFVSTADDLVPGDTNGVSDVFVRDATGAVTRVSVPEGGGQANGPSSHPSLSADGRAVAFQSDASNLVAGDTNATTDVFRRDRVAGTTVLVSVPAAAPPAGGTGAATDTAATTSVAAPEPRAVSASLTARAEVAPVRVIVRTATDFAPEGRLTRTRRTAQRAAIAADRAHVGATIGTGGRVEAAAHTLPIVVATVDRGALARLRADPHVASVTADDPVPAALVNSGPVVGLPAAQDAGFTGRGEAVAILDTGVDAAHPFLGDRVVEEACYSGLGNCPDGHASQTGPGSAAPCTYAPKGCRHGTHVAGIAVGSALDATGVAPRASVIAVQIFSKFTGALCTRGEDPCELTLPSDWLLALEHVYELRDRYDIAAVNMSIGGLTSTTACDADPMKAAVDQLASVGIATVIAAGNESRSDAVGYPGCVSSAVTVGATDNTDAPASFTNSSRLVDLFAPGVGVRSSVPGGGFANFNGTSMATPHVAGAFALAKEHDPDASVADVLAHMQSGGTTIHDGRNDLDFPRLCAPATLGFDRCPRLGSRRPSISAGGDSVAFESDAALVAGDTNGVTDVYVRSVASATTERVSVASDGTQANGASTHPSMSGTADLIAFDSRATNLVVGDTNGVADVFVRGRAAHVTARMSMRNQVSEATLPSRDATMDPDGTSVLFTSAAPLVDFDTNGVSDVYLAFASGSVMLVSATEAGGLADGPSRNPATGGGMVAFESDATNLVTGDTNGATDVYLRDALTQTTHRASTRALGGQTTEWSGGPAVARDGSLVAFDSPSGDLVEPTTADGRLGVHRRPTHVPEALTPLSGPVARGTTVPFALGGRGFVPGVILASDPGITVTVTSVSAQLVNATITVGSGVAPGPHHLWVVDPTAVPALFGASVCSGCVAVT